MEKENVLELKTRTEQGKEEGAKQVAEKGSTVAGKFKDVNALLTAYGALEAEFTRRSQRLKELERKLAEKEDGTEKSVEKVEAEKPEENSGSEGVSVEEAVESAVSLLVKTSVAEIVCNEEMLLAAKNVKEVKHGLLPAFSCYLPWACYLL